MHGLQQAGKIANDDLKQHLLPYGHAPTKHTPGLWRHTTSDLTFTLIVDDFGTKYTNIAQAKDLLHALQQKYNVTVDWTGALHASVSLEWEYLKRTVKLSITGYIKKVLIKHTHPTPNKAQHAPRKPEPIIYGPYQPANLPDNSKDLTTNEKLIFQSILGSLLHYRRMIDSTMLIAFNDLSITQTNATATSQRHLNTLLDQLFTNPNASILCRKFDMIAKVNSDGSYLSVPGARSRAAGHFYLGNSTPIQKKEPYQGAIY